MSVNSIENDLNYIIEETLGLWEELRHQRIFITGGTGFLGSWILESFSKANKKLKLNAEMVVLTRTPTLFLKKFPHLINDNSLKFHEGNVTNFSYPKGKFSYVIHAATETNYSKISSWDMLETIIQGTKYTLEFSKNCEVKKFLFVSSGAMYGQQHGIDLINENNFSKLESTGLIPSYSIGKFIAEYMCNLYAKEHKFAIKIARCFGFVGPYLPLNLHFAIGNFIKDRLNNDSILLKSNGYSYRSYLYMSDLCVWIWTILFRGKNLTAYNVGSNEKYSLLEIAELIANCIDPKIEVKVINAKKIFDIAPANYIPDITLAYTHLGLMPKISFSTAINFTINWFKKNQIDYS